MSSSNNEMCVMTSWILIEHIALAHAWVDVSEDPTLDNDHNRRSFWIKITTYFLREK